MQHFQFTDIVNKIADVGWGKEFATPEDASLALLGDVPKLSAFALIELLKRVNKIAAAAGESEPVQSQKMILPSTVKAFKDKNVGDRLWSGDLDEGLTESIVIAKNDDGICMIVDVYEFSLDCNRCASIACDWHYATVEEAVEESAKNNVEYHTPKLAFARAALKAVKTKTDLSEFINGISEED